MVAGCPVCGYGRDWRWWPEWSAVLSGTVLHCFTVGWMEWEYLCDRCRVWATQVGAAWDGKVKFEFAGFKITENTIDPRTGEHFPPNTNAKVIKSRYCPGS